MTVNSCRAVAALAIAAAFAIILILVVGRGCDGSREKFTGDPSLKVFQAARDLFESNPHATYSDYKAQIPGADPVQYNDVRNLWLSRRLTPATVRQAL